MSKSSVVGRVRLEIGRRRIAARIIRVDFEAVEGGENTETTYRYEARKPEISVGASTIKGAFRQGLAAHVQLLEP